VRCANLGQLLGRAPGNDLAAQIASFRAQFNDPVGGHDHIQVVLDHDHGVAVVAQLVEHFQQVVDVVEVQSSSRFVEGVEGSAGIAFRELAREFDPRCLVAGQRGGVLAQGDIGESRDHQGLQFSLERRYRVEEVCAS
jgi:hypothetical protein